MVGDKGQIFSPDDYGTSFYLKLKDEKEFSSGLQHPAVQKAIPAKPSRRNPTLPWRDRGGKPGGRARRAQRRGNFITGVARRLQRRPAGLFQF